MPVVGIGYTLVKGFLWHLQWKELLFSKLITCKKMMPHTKLVVMLSTVGKEYRDSAGLKQSEELVLVKSVADRNSSVRVLSLGGRAVELAVL